MKKMIFFLVLIIVAFNSDLSALKNEELYHMIELKRGWKFHQADKMEWMPAEVPGTVHTDLFQNGKIGDPFYRTNERDQQWIDKVDWEYQILFNVDADLLNKDKVRLVFKGLDTYADVYLNGKIILNANNMFREWKVDCKSELKAGINELKIYFHSPIKIDLPKLERLGYQLPAVNDQSENGGLGKKKISIFARKAPYHYGWDWGPRFVTSGIWRPIYLEAWDCAKIEGVQIIQKKLNKTEAVISVVYEILSTGEYQAEIKLFFDQNKAPIAAKSFSLKSGLNKIDMNFSIEQPNLWWCNGLGSPYLYSILSQLIVDGMVCQFKKDKFGVRTLKIVQEKDKFGKSFYVELNGVPVFAKGANYIPMDNFIPRVSDEKYERIIKAAAAANMNMIRVWGGGIYENDIFYDLCDQYGIMVWQDFMFACSMYPGDDAFMENVRQEAIQNVKRLRNHPCLALWCGNNEIDVAWSQDTPGGWGWKKRFDKKTREKLWNDYEKLFHLMLPEIVREYDPKTFYWPSSPLADLGKRASYSSTSGDMHYWGVWHGKEPFENFEERIPRFMSEYGFQSFPELKTVEAYTLPEDRDISSEVMAAHQRSGIGNERIKEYMGWYYQVPHKFEDLLYVGQVLQAEGIKIGMEAHRRHKPYCMGTLYWQLNDCWPVASWSSIDYFGRWKALHYFARKAYQDLLVSLTVENDKLSVFVVSDQLESVKGELKLDLIDFSGNIIWQQSLAIKIPANNSQVFFDADVDNILKGAPRHKTVFRAQLKENDHVVSGNLLYFLPVKELSLPHPVIRKQIISTDKGYRILLTTDKLAKNVYLSIEEIEGFFTDNYFDLLPGETVEVNFLSGQRIENFKEKLKLKTIRDTYK